MSQQAQAARSGGITLAGALFVLFCGLKLTGYINWSWWWVTAPLWGPWAVIGVLIVIFGIIWLICLAIDAYNARKRRQRLIKQWQAAAA